MKNIRVFLGGTCNGSKWRDKIIPLLLARNYDYFNPVVDDWDDDAYNNELYEKNYNCTHILIVITPLMLGVYSIAEAVYYAIKFPEKTIFCVLNTDNNVQFNNEQMNSLTKVMRMITECGATVCTDLYEVVKSVRV